ncbi:hypothetical protein EON64_13880 [archaeon]|nr:MAG: hypothetical protein EON64_13880 [archaeon]
MVLFETEDDETTSKGGLYRKWHLLTLFLYSFVRIFVHSVDPVLVIELGTYNNSLAQSALYIIPPTLFIIHSTYFIFYLSYLCSELRETSQRSSFSWRWMQCSGVYIIVCMSMVLLQLPPYSLYSLLAASCGIVALGILYCYVQLYSALSSRIATSARRVIIRLALLVLVSLTALSLCIYAYAQAAYLDHSHR